MLLRLVIGGSLMVDTAQIPVVQHAPKLGVPLIVGVGLCVIAGMWTPVVGALQVAIELSTIAWGAIPDRPSTVLAAVGASLVMLGPGAWSVDARLFGRKRIDL